MDTFAAIAARHSARQFVNRPVSKEILEKLVDAGRLAPTARNEQPWEFVVVTGREVLKRIGDFTDHGKFIGRAVACIAVFCKDTKYYLEDGCAATENIIIAAADLGVDSCWVAGDKKPYGGSIRELLGAPSECKLVSLIALGYAGEKTPRAKKRDLKEVLHWEKF